MPRRVFTLAASLYTFVGCLPARGQAASQGSSTHVETTDDNKNNKAILEVGSATNWTVSGGAAQFAPNLVAEITAIEKWLELEVGVSPFYTHATKEWDLDLLFKKPWTLSPGRICHPGLRRPTAACHSSSGPIQHHRAARDRERGGPVLLAE